MARREKGNGGGGEVLVDATMITLANRLFGDLELDDVRPGAVNVLGFLAHCREGEGLFNYADDPSYGDHSFGRWVRREGTVAVHRSHKSSGVTVIGDLGEGFGVGGSEEIRVWSRTSGRG